MSYHVVILRTARGQAISISREETEGLLAARQDLTFEQNPSGHLEIGRIADGDAGPLLIWQDGEIWTKNPDRDTLQLMIDLAGELRARVRGDEFETYRTPDETYIHSYDERAVEDATQESQHVIRRARRRQWIVHAVILGMFAVLAFLAHLFSGS